MTNENTIVKHLSGWLNAENMQNPGWIEHWMKNADDAKKEDNQLVVFSLKPSLVEKVELYIQSISNE